jgi:excisionase family DNA binding protein
MARKTQPEAEPRFALFNDACDYAVVPPGTMRDWIRRGVIPAYRIGPRLLQIDLNDIDRLRRRVPAAAVKPKSA